eukprot:5057773-Karenia_brevis.AAC.1
MPPLFASFRCICTIGTTAFAPSELQLKTDKEADDTQCKCSVMTGTCPDMKLFHVPPPAFPSRHLTLSIEPRSKNTVHL